MTGVLHSKYVDFPFPFFNDLLTRLRSFTLPLQISEVLMRLIFQNWNEFLRPIAHE